MDLKKQILEAEDRKFIDVPVPEWGCTVRLRELSGTQQGIARDSTDSPTNMGRAMLLLSLSDPETNRQIFDENDVDDLYEKNSSVLQRLLNLTLDLTGINDEAIEDAEKK